MYTQNKHFWVLNRSIQKKMTKPHDLGLPFWSSSLWWQKATNLWCYLIFIVTAGLLDMDDLKSRWHQISSSSRTFIFETFFIFCYAICKCVKINVVEKIHIYSGIVLYILLRHMQVCENKCSGKILAFIVM